MKTPKDSALKDRLNKTHQSREYCRHCGKETSRSVRHESGHREWDHEKDEKRADTVKG